MEYDPNAIEVGDRYKLLCGLVTPRPIALVTSMNHDGSINAAPFSFFNVIGHDPPLVVLGFDSRADGGPKDTVRNIRGRGEFVVNLIDEDIVEPMNICGGEYPYLFDELAAAGLTSISSTRIKTNRVKEAPASFECIVATDLNFGPRRTVIIGEIVQIHIQDGLVGERFHVDQGKRRAVGRMAGSHYTRTTDRFTVLANHNKEWQSEKS